MANLANSVKNYGDVSAGGVSSWRVSIPQANLS